MKFRVGYILFYFLAFIIAAGIFFDFSSHNKNENALYTNVIPIISEYTPCHPAPQIIGPLKKLDISTWGDSGLLVKNELLPWLIQQKLTDSIGTAWYLFKPTDTLGKYYKTKDSTWYLCFIDLTESYEFETHVIAEINSKGNVFRQERFHHGNYPPWLYIGFKKIKDYYYFSSHGTGSAYSSTYFYLFEKLKPQDSMLAIPQYCWSGFSEYEDLSINIHSSLSLQKNYLTIHYEFEYSDFETEKIDKRKTKKYTLYFSRKNDKWSCLNKKTMMTIGQTRFLI